MIEDLFEKIKKDFPEEKVCEMLDCEILNWVDNDWQEECDHEYEWYCSYGRGEAEQVVIEDIINCAMKNYNIEIKDENYTKLYKLIKDEYYPLR